jgi:hypothetical protein
MQHAARQPGIAPSLDILAETLDALRSVGSVNVSARRIVQFRLSRYFTIVELDDGSVGSCMSYAQDADSVLAAKALLLNCSLVRDPLGLDFIHNMPDDPLCLSLRASVVSALSEPLLRAGGDAGVLVSDRSLWDPLEDATSALVVGFGGYMRNFALDPRIERLHVADLGYEARRDEMDRMLDRYRATRPEAEFTISDGRDTCKRAGAADVVAITGSALCNGSMQQLLAWARGRRVIVQGQSAAMYPQALFARGVAMVATTLKPANLVDIADHGGMSDLLEGGLPWVYLYQA